MKDVIYFKSYVTLLKSTIITFAEQLSITSRMEKNQNNLHFHKFESKSNQPVAGNERENPQINPGNPLPNNPEKNNPTKPDVENDPTTSRPGGNEPQKNDPTRIAEPSPAKTE